MVIAPVLLILSGLLNSFSRLSQIDPGFDSKGVVTMQIALPSVTQRTHEIGIRMVLGTERNDVLGMVVRQGMTIAPPGVAAPDGGYGVTAKDPLTFLLVPLALLLVAALANYLPARKATRVDPLIALGAD